MKLFIFSGRIIFIFTVLFVLLITGCDSSSDSNEELGDSWLKIAGGEYSLAKLRINNDGFAADPVYKHYLTITSENLDLNEGTGSGEFITVVLFSLNVHLPEDDYIFSSGVPEGGVFIRNETYDGSIMTDFLFPAAEGTQYDITGGTISVRINGTEYTITGDVSTTGGTAAFRYIGEATIVGE